MSDESAEARATWTNSSVLAFAEDEDPLAKAAEVAQALLEVAKVADLAGPPVDVMALANVLGLGLRPLNEVDDARLVERQRPDGNSDEFQKSGPIAAPNLMIDYNPSRPRGRLRFSIAHELAHACFPDVTSRERHRTAMGAVEEVAESDDWELELLCNVIAAELLMPTDAVAGLLNIETDIDFIMEYRRKWDVSTEALFRRLVAASPRSMVMIAASRTRSSAQSAFRVDYAFASQATNGESHLRKLRHRDLLEQTRGLVECTAVGQTSRGSITLAGREFAMQCVGVPGYPGSRFARVLALVEEPRAEATKANISYVQGDVLDAIDGGRPVLLAHVVSDSVRGWGRFGVAASLARRLPNLARAFRAWTLADSNNLMLGNVHMVDQPVDAQRIEVASMVAQYGFGRGESVRLRYDALEECLAKVAVAAKRTQATVHIPRIGAGQAGGRWDVIEDLLAKHLGDNNVPVVVHTLPSQPMAAVGQRQ